MKAEDAPFNVWLKASSGSQACPECKSPEIAYMRKLTVTGPANVAGVQLKFSAQERWIFCCRNCGIVGRVKAH